MACATKPEPVTQTEFVTPDIRPGMLTCEFAPEAPADSVEDQAPSATYEAQLFAAWESCYGNLYAVARAYNEWLEIIAAAQAKERDVPDR